MADGTPQGHQHLRDHRDGRRRHHDAGHLRLRADRHQRQGQGHGPLPRHGHPAEGERASRGVGHASSRWSSSSTSKPSTRTRRPRQPGRSMLIALGVFSVVMLIILGAYFLLVVRDEKKLPRPARSRGDGNKRARRARTSSRPKTRSAASTRLDKVLRQSEVHRRRADLSSSSQVSRCTVGTFLLAIACVAAFGLPVRVRSRSASGRAAGRGCSAACCPIST